MRERISSRLHIDSAKPDAGLELRNCEIVTLTDWATQVAPYLLIFFFYILFIFETQSETEREQGRGRERRRQRI